MFITLIQDFGLNSGSFGLVRSDFMIRFNIKDITVLILTIIIFYLIIFN
jgi:hypothetical protein